MPTAGYAVKHEQINVAGVATLHIRSLRDRQQFFDPLGTAAGLGISSAAWPLFGLLWPSGQQLAQRMAVRPVVPGERILEIGCGLALASLVSHRRGADVTASDCHPLTARFLRVNTRLNGLAALPYLHGPWSHAPGDVPVGESRVAGRFDLLIGSDLLYERDDGALLPGFIARHASPGAEVWIVDPNRGNRAAFNRQMAERGFVLAEQRIDQPGYHGRLLAYRKM